MQTQAGRAYELRLALHNAGSVGPSWLAATVMATYPEADLVEVSFYDGKSAVAVIRWRKGTGEIAAGDRLMVGAEGIELPTQLFPWAVVDSVVEVQYIRHPDVVVSDSVQELDPEYNAALKLIGAAAIVGLVGYLSQKIRRKHVGTGRA